MKIALAQLNYTVGDIKSNTEKIIAAIGRAKEAGADIAVFAEFAISGTPAYGLLTKTTFLTLCEEAVESIASKCKGIAAIVGTPYLTAEGPISAAAYIDPEGNIEYLCYIKKTENFENLTDTSAEAVVEASYNALN